MSIWDSGYEQALIDAGRNPITRPPAGFLESFRATYEATRQEELSISERQNFLDKVKDRNEKILELTGKPFDADPWSIDIPEGQLSTTVERARLAAQRRIGELSARYPEVKSDEDLVKEIVEDSQRIREQTARVLENTTFAGKIGSFTGAMAATLTDPLVFGTIPFGASASAGILRTFLTEAGMAAASEALIQPFVYRYKQQLGSPYDVGEALTRIGAAGIGGGAIAGLLKGGARLLTRSRIDGVDDLLETFERHSTHATQIEKDAAHVLGDYADVLRESPFEVGHPELDERHLRATAKAIADVEAGRPVDVVESLGVDVSRLPRAIAGVTRETPATTNQSLAQFVKNSGGVSIEKSGALRGEYEALFESGGRASGAVKRRAGRSPDELAQLAREAGFLDSDDPADLLEALQADLSGRKVYSIQGDRFERRMDLEIEREYQRYVEIEEAAYLREIEAQARAILETEDMQIPTGRLLETESGDLIPETQSARELLQQADEELTGGNILRTCLVGG